MANERGPGGNVQITEAVRLCLSCGICCTGVLFAYAPLKQDEIELATKAGLEEYTTLKDDAKDDEGPAFKLPCVCWEDNCTIYPDRPDICGSYRCHLLQRLDDGKVDLERALETVRRTKNLENTITPSLITANVSESLWARFGQFLENQTAKGGSLDYDDKEISDLLLTVGMLRAMLKEFEPDVYVNKMPGET